MKLFLSRHVDQNKNLFYHSINEKLKNEELIYVLVPEQFTLGTEIEVYEKLNVQSTFNLRIKSFKTIINEVMHNIGGRGYKFASDSTKYIILQSILLEKRNELNIFNKNVYDKDFIELLIKFIDEMTKNDYGIPQIEELISLDMLSNELKEKLSDVLIILKSYKNLLSESKFSTKSIEDISIENIKHIEQYKDINFFVYRFHDMSRKELKLLSEINKIAKEVSIFITIDDRMLIANNQGKFQDHLVMDSEVFSISEKFIKNLNMDEYQNSVELFANNKRNGNYSDIEKFLDNLFSYDIDYVSNQFKDVNKKLSDIRLMRSKNTTEEVENLIIEINKFIRQGNKFKDIAILTTNSSQYYPIIKKLFRLNDIPFFLDENRNLLDNAMIKNIKACIMLLNSRMSNISVVQFLKNTFLPIDEYKIDIFQSFIERRRITGNMFLKDEYFQIQKRKEDEYIKYEDEDIKNLEIVHEVLNLIRDILNSVDDIKNIIKSNYHIEMKEYVSILYNLLTHRQFIQGYQNYIDKFTFENKEEILEENKVIWEKFVDILDDLYNVEFGEKFDIKRLSDIVLSTIDNFKVGIIPPSRDQIIIGDALRSRFVKVKKLFVLGMTNLYYPISNSTTDILSDEEKDELVNITSDFDIPIELTNRKEKINSNNLLSFYELLYTSNKYIDFSYSLINSSNEAMEESSINKWIKVMIKEENILEDDIKLKDYVLSKTLLQTYLPKKIRDMKEKGIDNTQMDQFIKYIKDNTDGFNNVLNAVELTKKDYTRKNLDKETVKMIFNTNKFSVSQLELFNSNPYDHFIRYGLKPREYNTYDISPLDVGNILHDYMKEYIENKYIFKNENNAKDIFDNSIKNKVEDFKIADNKNKFYIKQMKRNANQYSNIVDKQLSLTNVDNFMLEIEYKRQLSKGKDKINAIEVDIDGNKVLLEGKIDRIDEFNYNGKKYFRIIDYKTGGKEFNIGKIYAGIDMQLLLYLSAILNENKEYKPLGVFYQRLKGNLDIIGMKEIDIDSDSEILNDYKMYGIINDDVDLYKYIDSEGIDERNVVDSFQYKYNGRAKFFNKKDNVVSEYFFEKLIEQNENNIKESIQRLFDGVIDLNPYKIGDEKSDKYSNYKTIHKNEGSLGYRNLDKYSWDEIRQKFGEDDV